MEARRFHGSTLHPRNPSLRPGDVKVFCVSVDQQMNGGHEYAQLLDCVGDLHSISEMKSSPNYNGISPEFSYKKYGEFHKMLCNTTSVTDFMIS